MSDRSVQEAIQKLAGTHLSDEVYVLTATVKAVSLENRTCDCEVISGTAVTDINNVQLMAEVNDGFLLVPALDSTVIITYSKRNVPHISMFSEIETASLVTLNGIKLQGDEFGGLVKLDTLLKKINALETTLNALNTKVNVLAPTPVIPPLIVSLKSELENPNVKHGA